MRFRAVLILTAVCTATITVRAEETFETKRDITYVKREDTNLKADLYIPHGEGPFPTILLVHGGAWRRGHRSQMSEIATTAATNGYTAVSISYRLAPKHPFPAQIEDCKAAVRWMRGNAEAYKIDPERIAGYGYSAGGHLVCLLGTTDADDGLEGAGVENGASTRLQAVVAGGAPCDFQRLPGEGKSLAYWLGGSRSEKPETYKQASPTTFVTDDDPPMFFFHGENDRLVPKLSPLFMSATLKQAGIAADVHMIEKAGHFGAFMNREAHAAAMQFLDAILK